MATKTINVDVLAKMFLAGAQNIEAKKDYINELNVFPVPDGDTGTNMSMTIMSAAKEVTALNNPEMKDLAKAISSGSLRGARGNSGVILSQLLRGFTKAIKEEKEIDVLALAAACQRARDTAYKAVMKPKEGTILTVASGIATKAAEMAEETDDLEAFPVRKYHIDTNEHVNNCQYVQMALDVWEEMGTPSKIRELRVEYKKSAVYGDMIYPSMIEEQDNTTIVLGDEKERPYAIVQGRGEN